MLLITHCSGRGDRPPGLAPERFLCRYLEYETLLQTLQVKLHRCRQIQASLDKECIHLIGSDARLDFFLKTALIIES